MLAQFAARSMIDSCCYDLAVPQDNQHPSQAPLSNYYLQTLGKPARCSTGSSPIIAHLAADPRRGQPGEQNPQEHGVVGFWNSVRGERDDRC